MSPILLTAAQVEAIRRTIRTALGLSVVRGAELRLQLELNARFAYAPRYSPAAHLAFLAQSVRKVERIYPSCTTDPYVWRLQIDEGEVHGDTLDECLDQALDLAAESRPQFAAPLGEFA